MKSVDTKGPLSATIIQLQREALQIEAVSSFCSYPSALSTLEGPGGCFVSAPALARFVSKFPVLVRCSVFRGKTTPLETTCVSLVHLLRHACGMTHRFGTKKRMLSSPFLSRCTWNPRDRPDSAVPCRLHSVRRRHICSHRCLHRRLWLLLAPLLKRPPR